MPKSLFAAWRFLTIVPCPWFRDGDEAEALRKSPACFPPVGLILGLAASLATWISTWFLPVGVVAVLAIGMLAGFSGGLHLDGLADSADALLSPGHDRARMLAVMKDSRVGAHGAMALVVAILAKYACLASLGADALPWTVLAMPVAGRAMMLFPMALLPYAREKGLGTLFVVDRRAKILGAACLWTAAALFLCLDPRNACVGFLIWFAAAFGWAAFLKKRLGGATGDTYGAACEMGELAACLAAAIQ